MLGRRGDKATHQCCRRSFRAESARRSRWKVPTAASSRRPRIEAQELKDAIIWEISSRLGVDAARGLGVICPRGSYCCRQEQLVTECGRNRQESWDQVSRISIGKLDPGREIRWVKATLPQFWLSPARVVCLLRGKREPEHKLEGGLERLLKQRQPNRTQNVRCCFPPECVCARASVCVRCPQNSRMETQHSS